METANIDTKMCECKDTDCSGEITDYPVKASFIPRKKDIYRHGYTEQNDINFSINLCEYHRILVNNANEIHMTTYGKYPGGWDNYDILDEIVHNYRCVYNKNY